MFTRNVLKAETSTPISSQYLENQVTDKVYLSDSRVTNIFKSFTYKMAAKISWHRYGKKLRHCHPVYIYLSVCPYRAWLRAQYGQSVKTDSLHGFMHTI